MKKIFLLFLIGIINTLVFTDILPQFELDYIKNEEGIIKKDNLISKQKALESVFESLNNGYYAKMNKTDLRQIVNDAEVILVEQIDQKEEAIFSNVNYYYSIQVKSKNGRILLVASINAQTGESEGSSYMDKPFIDSDGIEKNHFFVLLKRTEIVDYVKKNFTFSEDSKLIIQAVYDYSFLNDKYFPNLNITWKYRITIIDDYFKSSTYPAGIDTIFISPYTEGTKEKKEEPTPNNDIYPESHRIYTYRINIGTAVTRSLNSVNLQEKYIGID